VGKYYHTKDIRLNGPSVNDSLYVECTVLNDNNPKRISALKADVKLLATSFSVVNLQVFSPS